MKIVILHRPLVVYSMFIPRYLCILPQFMVIFMDLSLNMLSYYYFGTSISLSLTLGYTWINLQSSTCQNFFVVSLSPSDWRHWDHRGSVWTQPLIMPCRTSDSTVDLQKLFFKWHAGIVGSKSYCLYCPFWCMACTLLELSPTVHQPKLL